MSILETVIDEANEHGMVAIDDLLTKHSIEVVSSNRDHNLTTLVVNFKDGRDQVMATIAYVKPRGTWFNVKERRH